MIDNRPIFVPANPQGIDLPLMTIQKALIDCFGVQNKGNEERRFSWLDKSFGKAERRLKEINGRNTYYPSFHVKGQYLSLFPDEHIGNFTWFDVLDPIEVNQLSPYSQSRFTANVGLVFWWNYKIVFPDTWQSETIENVKAFFIRFFSSAEMNGVTTTIQNIEERTQNIYTGYTHNELRTQYLMHPYGAIRVNFELKYTEKCQLDLYEYFANKR